MAKKVILTEEKALREGKIGYFIPIEQLNLPQRTLNVLRRFDCPYLGEVLMYSEKSILKCRDMGVISLNELKGKIQAFGLSFNRSSEYIDWVPENAEEIAQKYFSPFISVEKSFELFSQGKVFDFEQAEINLGLLIPLKFVPTLKLSSLRWASRRNYVFVGDLVSSFELQKQRSFIKRRSILFEEMLATMDRLGFEYKDCSENWKYVGDIYALSAEKFPDKETVTAFLEKHKKQSL